MLIDGKYAACCLEVFIFGIVPFTDVLFFNWAVLPFRKRKNMLYFLA